MKLEQEILEAIREDDVNKFIANFNELKKLDKNTDINYRTSSSALTYLHEAVASESTKIVKIILRKTQLKANLTANYKTCFKITAFHLAAIKGNEHIFTCLMLSNGVDINAVSGRGRTALHYLAKEGHKNLLKIFLEQMFLKIKLNKQDEYDKKFWEYLSSDSDEDKKLIDLLKRAEESQAEIKKLFTSANVQRRSGEKLMLAGHYSAAIVKFTEVLRKYRKAMEPLPEFTQPIFVELLNVYFLRGKANFCIGELDNAAGDYLHIAINHKIYTDSSDIFSVRKFICFYLWEVYTKLQDEDSASKYYKEAISAIEEKELVIVRKNYKARVEKYCKEHNENMSKDERNSYYYTNGDMTALLWKYSQQDEKPYIEMVKLFLRMRVRINEIILEDACEEITALFTYRPSKHDMLFLTIYDFCKPLEGCADSVNLNLYFVDYENTSDEDSSDSEEDTFQVINQELLEESYPYQFARGVHYSPNYYNTQDCNDFKNSESHKKTVYSRAISELAEKLERKSDDTLDFEHADALVKSYFEMLKITPDKTEYDENHKAKNRRIDGATAKFESLYHHFIHVYVNPNGYNTLFNNGGMADNFNFYSNDNPTLSVTPNVEVAFRYGSGERINHTSRFFGKLRRSTGAFKHRHLGFVQVYLVSSDYYKKHAADIDKLNKAKKISVAHNYSFNQEVLFESSIPAEYVLGYQIFSLPSFRGAWSEDTQRKYGLNKIDYEKCRKSLLDAAENFQTDEIEKIIKKLIEDITKHQATKLVKSLDQLQKFSSEDEYDFSVEDDREISEGMSKMGIEDSKEEILDLESPESESSDSQNRP